MKYFKYFGYVFCVLAALLPTASAAKDEVSFCSHEGYPVFVDDRNADGRAVVVELLQGKYTPCSVDKSESAPQNLKTDAWCTLHPVGTMTAVSCRGFVSVIPWSSLEIKGIHFRAIPGSEGYPVGMSLVDYLATIRIRASIAAAAVDNQTQ